MKTIRKWYREYRREGKFLREHKDEYYPMVKTWAWCYALHASAIGILLVTGMFVSLTSQSTFLAFWFGVPAGILMFINGSGVMNAIDNARGVIAYLKKEYNYNTNH
ncbi:MAG: hypothetical protein ACXADO_00670 [Candidatus Thorarchaeota archaeon]|jgi:hypothetical protein